jgi:phage baseplate assembly protein V
VLPQNSTCVRATDVLRSMQRMHEAPSSLLNLMRYGTVVSVDVASARAVVTVGGLTTKPLPWLTPGAGAVRTWSPPSPGEQVMVLAPAGNLGAAVVLHGLFSNHHPAPEGATADNVVIAFGDGAVLLYDMASHALRGTLPAGGRVELTAPAGFRLVGDMEVDGQLHVTKAATVDDALHASKDITSDADVKAGDISLRKHPHGGVQRGGDLSGKALP